MTTLPVTKSLILDLKDGWLTIWFNSPENRNALSAELSSELRDTLLSVRNDRSVRGITIRGKGDAFCAGGDLKSFSALFHEGGAAHADVAAVNEAGGEIFELVNTMPQVVVALVDGAAIAGGLGIVCCCDVVVVTAGAKFSLTETQIGIAPAQIAPFIVQRLGTATARRLMLTGARFKGEEAGQIGLADYVVADSDAFDAVESEIRANVMQCAPGANAVTKEIILSAPALSSSEMRAFAADKFATCMLSEEGREGIASFIERRKPIWASKG